MQAIMQLGEEIRSYSERAEHLEKSFNTANQKLAKENQHLKHQLHKDQVKYQDEINDFSRIINESKNL